jgi:hypothetical protein
LFHVPADWVADWVDVSGTNGSGDCELVIFEDAPGSGTLRPWTELYRYPTQETREASILDLHRDGIVKSRDNNVMLSYAVSDAVEDEVSLKLHRWTVTIRNDANHLRLIVFTYSIETEQANNPQAQKDISWVESAVMSAVYPESESHSPQ